MAISYPARRCGAVATAGLALDTRVGFFTVDPTLALAAARFDVVAAIAPALSRRACSRSLGCDTFGAFLFGSGRPSIFALTRWARAGSYLSSNSLGWNSPFCG